MNFGELQQAVLDVVQRSDKDSVVKRSINWGVDRIARDHDCRILQTYRDDLSTTPNTRIVPLPSDLRVLHFVRVDGRIVHEIHPRELQSLEPNKQVESHARPRVFAQRGDSSGLVLDFWPVPDSEYTVELFYSRRPTPMVEDEDEPSIKHADRVIVAAGAYEVFLSIQDFESAIVWRNSYKNRLQEFAREDSRRDDWLPGRRYPVFPSPDPAFDPFVRRSL